MELLLLLVGRHGELVSREEIIAKLWGQDVFIETEHGINTAVRKIRQTLGDDPERSRFVQTVVGKGYRFVAAVSIVACDTWPPNGSQPQCNSELRKTLNDDPKKPKFIATIPKSGYRLIPAPENSRKKSLKRVALRWRWPICGFVGVLALTTVLVGLDFHWARSQFVKLLRANRPTGETFVVHSIAVLPLENLSGDGSQEYFADGMTDELITTLAKIGSLRVISRTSVMQYKGTHTPLPEIARALNVDLIIEGAVARSGNQVRITAQLIDCRSDTHRWAQDFDRDLHNVLELQSDIAQSIAREIRVELRKEDGVRLASRPTVNPAAQDAYLKGRYLWNRKTGQSIDQSIRLYRQAIAADANWAAPWAAMADSYIIQESEGRIPTQQAGPTIAAAANKAVELDPNLADAHLVMGQVKEMQWNWIDAEREYRRAIELNPGLARAHHWFSLLLVELDRPTEAISEIDRAVELEPLSASLYLVQSKIYYMARQYERAWQPLRMLKETEGNSAAVREFSGIVFLGQQMYAEATAEFLACTKAEPNEPEHLALLTYAYGRRGDHTKALHAYTKLQQLKNTRLVAPWWLAVAWVGMGNNDKAIEFLTATYRMRSSAFPTMQADPLLDPLRSDPRFQALLRQASMPSSWNNGRTS